MCSELCGSSSAADWNLTVGLLHKPRATELLQLVLEKSWMRLQWLGRKGQDETVPTWAVSQLERGHGDIDYPKCCVCPPQMMCDFG